jgi:hypothetical protein
MIVLIHGVNPFTARRSSALWEVPTLYSFKFWITFDLLNRFSISLVCFWTLCVYLQYKHPRSTKRDMRSDKPITSVFPVRSHKCDIGRERVKEFLCLIAQSFLCKSNCSTDYTFIVFCYCLLWSFSFCFLESRWEVRRTFYLHRTDRHLKMWINFKSCSDLCTSETKCFWASTLISTIFLVSVKH